MNDKLIKRLIIELSKIEISKLSKDNLIKLINLYEIINKTELINDIINKLDNNYFNLLSKIEIEILETKIKSFLNEITKKKYNQKIDNSDFLQYIYDNSIDIYFLRDYTYDDNIINNLIISLLNIQFSELIIYLKKKNNRVLPITLTKENIKNDLKLKLEKFDFDEIKLTLLLKN